MRNKFSSDLQSLAVQLNDLFRIVDAEDAGGGELLVKYDLRAKRLRPARDMKAGMCEEIVSTPAACLLYDGRRERRVTALQFV